MSARLLDAFRGLFEGQAYLHRDSSLGDSVSVELFEDLHALGRSPRLVASIDSRERGVGPRNKTVTLARMRRGDGTLGLLVDPGSARSFAGYAVARGAVATIDIGAESKILNKAMIKQIDRVVNDLDKQVRNWRAVSPRVIAVAIVGINHAAHTTSYEGDRSYPTDGRGMKHPFQEAGDAEQHIKQRVVQEGLYDEVVLLRYRATNVEPFLFDWVDAAATVQAYRAALLRISRLIDERF